MTYKEKEYQRIAKIIQSNTAIFDNDKGYGTFRKKQYPFILQYAENNLYAPIRSEAVNYFRQNQITWWGGKKITNHTLSSQAACLNHLFMIREDREAVLALIQHVDPNVKEILKINTDHEMAGYIQFEAVSDGNNLNEKNGRRGSNCTSIDAFIYGVRQNGDRVIYPIEWKYTEFYDNTSKSRGDSGVVRKERYTELINTSLQLCNNNQEVYYYEPFYQLMRQTLWAEQMIKNKDNEMIKADDYLHINVIPDLNTRLLKKKYCCSNKDMEDTWRACLKDQSKYCIITPQSLMSPIDSIKYKGLIDYLRTRYWEA